METFEHQFRKRHTRFEDMSKFWKDIYTLQVEFAPLLRPIEEAITFDEWQCTVSDLSNNSAAGQDPAYF